MMTETEMRARKICVAGIWSPFTSNSSGEIISHQQILNEREQLATTQQLWTEDVAGIQCTCGVSSNSSSVVTR